MILEGRTAKVLAGVCVGVVVVAGVVGALALGGGETAQRAPKAATSAAAEVASAPAVATPAPTATPEPPTATPEPALPGRTSCEEIRGTAYRSEQEQQFFAAKCIPTPTSASYQTSATTPPRTAAPTQPPATESCANSVAITSSFPEVYFFVSGSTGEEIVASLNAQAPLVGGMKAVGVTEYRFDIRGSRCQTTTACSLGAMTIDIKGKVTLPKHLAPASIAPEVVPLWNRFVERVSVHEYRHVTIVKEGTEGIKNQLLALEPQPTCAEMDHQVERVIFWGMDGMKKRQEAFHQADVIGAGGLVAR